MKNSNNNQDRKFNNQLNHMQSFIGMPMWNGRNPSLSEIREYERRLLEKHALGFKPIRKSLLKRLFSQMLKAVSKAFGQIAKSGKKTSDIKHEITKPINLGTECCG